MGYGEEVRLWDVLKRHVAMLADRLGAVLAREDLEVFRNLLCQDYDLTTLRVSRGIMISSM